jgi:hypothetical protein
MVIDWPGSKPSLVTDHSSHLAENSLAIIHKY